MLGAKSTVLKWPWPTGVHAGLPKRSLALRIWDMCFKSTASNVYESGLTKLKKELMLSLEDKGGLSRPIFFLEKAVEMFNVVNAQYFLNSALEFNQFMLPALEDRINRGMSEPDVMSYLLGENNKRAKNIPRKRISPTSVSRAMAIFKLAHNPQVLRKVAKKIDGVVDIINEALRRYLSVMSGLQHFTPPEGIFVNGRHIPMKVRRDPKPVGNDNVKAFNPCSYRSTGYISKQLELRETSKLATGLKSDGWLEKYLLDTLTICKEDPIRVVLTMNPAGPRKGV
ncbi:hypothetical protein K437DRAFT_263488 [Tilletiaria anomala UBC 951]|uniref:Uncharacterized protein n=1 Tax=Tilletiaria anomala (strain ATCC 24038 / CBS 436.72 / UBC 951) TaxID=1037660 RepID=A0A066VPL3_TILAU|nr:uncharacterized protein K437DRAFT_263488 [Tilletiaria anomala UBC 951]KDN43692.1 hypothetical protein K437DRAFT_263488 [Tilletiaria anomala UBC 951]